MSVFIEHFLEHFLRNSSTCIIYFTFYYATKKKNLKSGNFLLLYFKYYDKVRVRKHFKMLSFYLKHVIQRQITVLQDN